ncbi:MAG: SGNH/GDSL hydrolase family protein [Lachnospiraceae bacterium]|nr:SGNH/GDSL hydrolase family protein [Lachnospiraceae bacterium]
MIKNTVRKMLAGIGFCILLMLSIMACGGPSEVPAENELSEEEQRKEERTESEEQENDLLEESVQVEETNLQDRYTGKRLSILGDSLSTFEGWIPEGYGFFFPYDGDVKDVEQTWWKMLQEDMGMELCGNSSSSGSTCAGDSLSTDNPWYACSDYRIAELVGKGGIYPDVIIVYLGTNDLLTAVPIGENDGSQPVEEGVIENFSDAYSLILDKLEAQYPSAYIFCCTLAEIGEWKEQSYEIFENRIGLTFEDYNAQIELIAETRDHPVIYLQYCGISVDNMEQYVTDGVHFNAEGMKLVRDEMKNAFLEFEFIE